MATDVDRRPTVERTRSRRPWDAIAILAVAIGGVVVIALTKPQILSSSFGSPLAVAVTLGCVAALIGVGALLRRYVAQPAVRFVVLLACQALVAWWLVLPFYAAPPVLDQPLMAAPGGPEVVAADGAGFPTAEAPVGEPEAPAAAPGPAAGQPDTAEAPDAAAPDPAAPAAPAAPPAAPPAPAEPVQLATGTLVGLGGHDAEGGVSTYQLPDGSQVVRFEEVAIENGPDYRLYLVPGADQATPADGAIDLGLPPGLAGSFNVTVPAGFDTTQPFTVLIWCRAFAVPIGGATQTAV